ncbi:MULTISPECIES: hypothetical protein [unclassified Moritella]|uniref:hypothetical protein n=1 Tax=unclassified Moritella TaxID=2637987 RepID=UPI001BA53A0E|nr:MULTISPECIES: hypothetical protein [unclassified Moritella]QUM80778.1 hypothetical protein HWV01_11050 [Moritella sp. 5]QUM85079.1 hypothetical protein HWV02_11505 [Moritella sp. 28]
MFKKIILCLPVIFSGFTYASCSVPNSLENMTLINHVESQYSATNPNAGAISKVTYTTDRYLNEFLNKEIGPFTGSYTYKVLDDENGVGIYLGDETKPLNKPSHTVIFKCLTDKYGMAIFTQIAGANEPVGRQNTLTYTIM